uniref:Uncharacterized protein n=1 Tax=Timema bartmani TaxID=61472 RepID=A0A7R9I3X3_9NEOP|nr:unnamed protein product [Timema bartmani]
MVTGDVRLNFKYATDGTSDISYHATFRTTQGDSYLRRIGQTQVNEGNQQLRLQQNISRRVASNNDRPLGLVLSVPGNSSRGTGSDAEKYHRYFFLEGELLLLLSWSDLRQAEAFQVLSDLSHPSNP